MTTWTPADKNSASYSNQDKGDKVSHLWDASNDNIWGEDNYPWQDEDTLQKTNWSKPSKNSAVYSNQAKS